MKQVTVDGFDIRYTHITDELYLKEWLSIEQVQTWFPISTEKELEGAVQCWVGFARYNASLTATINGMPCGMATLFLMPYRKVAHHALFKLVVAPQYQRLGIGTALLRNIIHLAKTYFHLDFIHTEVFEGNPLIHLLEQQGFTVYGRQEDYVKENGVYRARILYETEGL